MNAKKNDPVMEESQSQQVAPVQQSAVALQKRVTGGKPQGLDDVDMQTDLQMPRLSVIQLTSRLVRSRKAEIGDLCHSITEENFGKELEFIPLFMFKSRAQFEVGKGLVLLSRDNKTVDFGAGQYEQYIGKDVSEVPHIKDSNVSAIDWAGKEPPSFSLVYNFLILLRGARVEEFPMLLSFMRTSVSAAKDFISLITMANEDTFARAYKIATHIEENDKGSFAVPKISPLGRCTDQEYAIAQARFNELYTRRRNIAVDLNEHAE